MKKNKFIAEFTHNNKIFQFVLFNNKLHCIYGIENGDSSLTLTDEDRYVIVKVAQSLIVDEKKSYFVRNDQVNGIRYKIWYDSISKNYFWHSNDGGDYASNNILLNLKYNDMPSVVYSDYRDGISKYERKLNRKLKRKYGRNVLSHFDNITDESERIYQKNLWITHRRGGWLKNILVSGVICLTALYSLGVMNDIYVMSMHDMYGDNWKSEISNISFLESSSVNDENDNLEETLGTIEEIIEVPEITESIEDNIEYSWELIQDAILKNPHLTAKEKDFLCELRFVFDENYQYMDLNMIIERLATLEIRYNPESCERDYFIGGSYYIGPNYIEMFRTTSFEEVDISTFLHEFFHVLQSLCTHEITHELSNELFTREALRRLHVSGVLDKYGFKIHKNNVGMFYYYGCYEPLMYYWYDFAELIPQEYLSRYQFETNDGLLITGLRQNVVVSDYDYEEFIDNASGLLDVMYDTADSLHEVSSYHHDKIYDYLEYFYDLVGKDLTTDVNCFANSLFFEPSLEFTDTNCVFLLGIIGKSDYVQYSDIRSAGLDASRQMRTYFSDSFPETTIHLAFEMYGREEWTEILEATGDYGVTYTIVVDEDFQTAYSNFIQEDISMTNSR